MENQPLLLDEAMATFMDKLNTATDILSAKLVEVAPEALDGLINLVWAKGLFDLTSSLLLFLLFFFCLLFSAHVFKKALEEKYNNYDTNQTLGITSMFTGIGSSIGLVFFIIELFDFSMWLAVFYPEGALALKALNAAGIDI